MPSKLLSEYTAKKLYYQWTCSSSTKHCVHSIERNHFNVDLLSHDSSTKFVVKVDQGIKGRMKKSLVKLNVGSDEIEKWIESVDKRYTRFIVEPMVQSISKEFYVLIRNFGMDTEIIVLPNGGIDVGNIETMENVPKIIVRSGAELADEELEPFHGYDQIILLAVKHFYNFYQKYHLTFLEINPLAVMENEAKTVPLDMLAKYDSCSVYLWQNDDKKLLDQDFLVEGAITAEEKYIESLGQKTGSSLKFRLLNPNSRVWFILFGGGASVCFFDKWMKLVDSDPTLQPANYGELSGNPSRDFVYEYTKKIFELMDKSNISSDNPYYLIIGGGIANFTLVDKTFLGIVDAVDECHEILLKKNVRIYVRRGGPNHVKGLTILSECCNKYMIQCIAHGPEKPMTEILDDIGQVEGIINKRIVYDTTATVDTIDYENNSNDIYHPNDHTTCLILGSQTEVAQNMLDFDMATGRSTPSVVGFVDPSRRNITNVPLFWNKMSILVPVYPNLDLAIKRHPEVDGVVNFSSYRAAYGSTKQALGYPNIKFVSILAEGIAENQTKDLIRLSKKLNNKMLLGPSTIGAIFPGKFRIGNAGGKMDYLINTGLHQKGAVGIVTRSGGLLNELCYTVSTVGFGIAAAIAIGGDRYTGTTFGDIVRYYQTTTDVKLIVLLGEIGGIQEIEVANMVKKGSVTKPIIGLCLGSSADYLADDIQFGHAGADAQSAYEKATYKNSYMAAAGINVPSSWEQIAILLKEIGDKNRILHLTVEQNVAVPVSFDEAVRNGIVRRHPSFFCSISNERGEELTYNKVPVSQISSIGDVIGHLWFKKSLPDYLSKFYEKILIICADHGPAVSGAQNTIVTARAGRDLISSLCSGLLTIGPKFGGAINDAAINFYHGMKNKKDPSVFISELKIIPGIGHKHYSIYKPDNRVRLLDQYVEEHFTFKETVKYAKEIEKITIQKKPNLILNVDGFIAASMIDGLISVGFDHDEIEEILNNDFLNSFFILSRTIGLIGHHIDQKRLKQDLYRAPDDSIAMTQFA